MDFRRIQHFVHVSELGSLSKAAERLHIVQPALSQSIKRLEDELGTKLFTRSRKGMELTEAGNMFSKYAYGILNQMNRAKESLSTIGENPQGTVSIAMTASALHVLTVPLSRRLKQDYPKIKLNIEEGLAGNIQQGFEAGWYDLVVSYLHKTAENNPRVDSTHIEPLIEEELFYVTPYDSGDHRKEITFSELQDIPLIVPQDQHGVGGSIHKHAEESGFKINVAAISASLHPTIQLIEAGLGSSLLPLSAIYDRIDQKKLQATRVVKPRILHQVSMVFPSHKPLTQASIAVMEALRQTVINVHHNKIWPGKLLISEN